MPEQTLFAQHLLSLLAARQMSQYRLAQILGVSSGVITHVLRRGVKYGMGFHIELAILIANSLGVRIDELVPPALRDNA